MNLIVDRITEGVAICEKPDLSHVEISISKLPQGIEDGTVIIVESDGTYRLDSLRTQKRRNDLFSLQEKLFNKSK